MIVFTLMVGAIVITILARRDGGLFSTFTHRRYSVVVDGFRRLEEQAGYHFVVVTTAEGENGIERIERAGDVVMPDRAVLAEVGPRQSAATDRTLRTVEGYPVVQVRLGDTVYVWTPELTIVDGEREYLVGSIDEFIRVIGTESEPFPHQLVFDETTFTPEGVERIVGRDQCYQWTLEPVELWARSPFLLYRSLANQFALQGTPASASQEACLDGNGALASVKTMVNVNADHAVGPDAGWRLLTVTATFSPLSTGEITPPPESIVFTDDYLTNSDFQLAQERLLLRSKATTEETAWASSQEHSTYERDRKRKSDLTRIAEALDLSVRAGETVPLAPTAVRLDGTNDASSLLATYFEQVPRDPLPDQYYYGYRSDDGITYSLTAVLEDPTDPEGTTLGSYHLYTVTGGDTQ